MGTRGRPLITTIPWPRPTSVNAEKENFGIVPLIRRAKPQQVASWSTRIGGDPKGASVAGEGSEVRGGTCSRALSLFTQRSTFSPK